ncbi:chromosome segregation protein Spc25-domain-containing protein [Scheffersomyces xylosifermentans]|uniref:chromosome segregation protein Spc25-domain-containing protein n=1 Tax=Scheffersomyces xylosifermentans TaxID=1304137 RepID=UPI00315D3084
MSTESAIDQFDALQRQMSEFSANVDRTLADKRVQLISNRKDHAVKLEELKTQNTSLQSQIRELEEKESKTKENLKSAFESLQSRRVKVDELVSKQEQLKQEKALLEQQIGEISKNIESSSNQLTKSQNNLENQMKKNYPELFKYEMYLGLRIEVIQVDLMKFVFTNIDPENYDRPFWVELSVSEDAYRVGRSFPEIEPGIIKLLENEFNEHRELVKFLRTARNLLRECSEREKNGTSAPGS